MRRVVIFSLLISVISVSSFAKERERGSVVVTDNINHIYWQDNLSSKLSSEDWDDAVIYCDKLALNGMTHWRLPTFLELLSITDYSRVDPAIDSHFDEVAMGTYWTSTNFSASKARAWTIDFRTGKTYYNYKTTNHAVRCVKDMRDTMKDTKESR